MKNIKIASISDILKSKYKKIENNIKLAFIFAVFSTFFTHIVFLITRWINEDYFYGKLGEINMIEIGRWMPALLTNNYMTPIVFMIIAMVILGLISSMIVSMFKVKNKVYIFIISLLLTTFPVLALGFGYEFMVERYLLGMLFSILSIFLTNKYKFGFILGAIFLCISLGYYQSYISIAITLSILLLIFKVFDNIDIKQIIKEILKYLLMGVLGVVLYLITVKIICSITGISLLNYKGINNLGSFPPINIWSYLILRTYRTFIGFFTGKNFLNPMWYGTISQIILCFLSFILIVTLGIKEKIYKKKQNLFVLIALIVLLPFGTNIMGFVAYQSVISSLNIYQFVFILILPFLLLSKLEEKKYKEIKLSNLINLASCLCFIAGIALIWNNFVISNIYYLKISDYYTSTVQLTNRIYDRIEQVPNMNGQTKVMVGNKNGVYLDRRNEDIYSEIFLYDQGLWNQFVGYSPIIDDTDYKFHLLTNNIIGVNLNRVTIEEYNLICDSDEYDSMESWPHEDSIKYINDILVVKLS